MLAEGFHPRWPVSVDYPHPKFSGLLILLPFCFIVCWILFSSVNNNKNLLTLWLIIVIFINLYLLSLLFDIDHLRFDLFLRFAGTYECVCVFVFSICVYSVFCLLCFTFPLVLFWFAIWIVVAVLIHLQRWARFNLSSNKYTRVS